LFLVAPLSLLGGQAVRAGGGSLTRSKSAVQAVSQGQACGRCRVTRRAEVATRAGTMISVRRMVAVVAFAICGSVRLAAARVRLNAITAKTSPRPRRLSDAIRDGLNGVRPLYKRAGGREWTGAAECLGGVCWFRAR